MNQLRCRSAQRSDKYRDNNFLHRFPDHDQLRGSCGRMRDQFPALSPVVGFVVMIDVADENGVIDAVHDQANV